MKDYNELKDNEILVLTDRALEKYCQIEMAKQGVPFMDCPESPDYETIESPARVLYGLSVLSIFSIDEDIIKQLSDILENNRSSLRKTDYEYNNDKFTYEKIKLNENYSDSPLSFNLTTQSVYSNEQVEELKAKNKRNKDRLEAHENLMGKWEETKDQITEIEKTIYDKYYDVCNKSEELDTLLVKFKSYLKLSDNNKDIAMNFMKNTYTISEDQEKYLSEN